jgi:hypothetical protein
MELRVTVKRVYGTDMIYPVTYANEIKTLTGKKTLCIRDIDALQRMGFVIKYVLDDMLSNIIQAFEIIRK